MRPATVSTVTVPSILLHKAALLPLLGSSNRAALPVTFALTGTSGGVKKVGNKHSISSTPISLILILNSHCIFSQIRADSDRLDCGAHFLFSFIEAHVPSSTMRAPYDLHIGVLRGVLNGEDFNNDYEPSANQIVGRAGYYNTRTYVFEGLRILWPIKSIYCNRCFATHMFVHSLSRCLHQEQWCYARTFSSGSVAVLRIAHSWVQVKLLQTQSFWYRGGQLVCQALLHLILMEIPNSTSIQVVCLNIADASISCKAQLTELVGQHIHKQYTGAKR